MSRNIDVGKRGEGLAAAYLTQRGYRILEMNYRCALGEVDIVALDGDTLVFIEVKSRTNLYYGHPQEGVTRAKRKKLGRLAACYLGERGLQDDLQCRFDVAAVIIDRNTQEMKSIELIHDAF